MQQDEQKHGNGGMGNEDAAYAVCTEEQLAQSYARQGERVLYWGSGSPQGIIIYINLFSFHKYKFDMRRNDIAWRVLIALEEKQIAYRSVCISFSSGVLKSAQFRQLNPRMRVPVFVDGTTGAMMYECAAILEYLEKFYPNSLLPNDPMQYAMAQTRLHEANEVLSTVGEMVVYLRRVPVCKRTPEAVEMKWNLFEQEIKLWETYLDGRIYLVNNDAPCLCDFVFFTNIAYAVRCGLQLDGLYPRLAMFYVRMCARPSIEKTWPPHWKTTYGFSVLAKCHFCAGKGYCTCGNNMQPTSPCSEN